MLRECIRHEPLAKIVLHSEHFHSFFNYVEMSTFDIASDAFATFKVTESFLCSYSALESGWIKVTNIFRKCAFPVIQ